MTNKILDSKQYVINYVLKSQIDEYMQKLKQEGAKKFIAKLFVPCKSFTVQSSPKINIQIIGDSNTGKTSFVKYAEFNKYQTTLPTIV